nr:MAG TPA: hypothetical protein [Caudoviricetes sp.]DAP36316.1 MAG TPA: hypothetical protein [Caudoviricetes sp.]
MAPAFHLFQAVRLSPQSIQAFCLETPFCLHKLSNLSKNTKSNLLVCIKHRKPLKLLFAIDRQPWLSYNKFMEQLKSSFCSICRQTHSITKDNLSQRFCSKKTTFVFLPKKQGQVLEVI